MDFMYSWKVINIKQKHSLGTLLISSVISQSTVSQKYTYLHSFTCLLLWHIYSNVNLASLIYHQNLLVDELNFKSKCNITSIGFVLRKHSPNT